MEEDDQCFRTELEQEHNDFLLDPGVNVDEETSMVDGTRGTKRKRTDEGPKTSTKRSKRTAAEEPKKKKKDGTDVPRQKQVLPSTPVPKRTGVQQEQQTRDRDTRNTIKKPATTDPAHSTNKKGTEPEPVSRAPAQGGKPAQRGKESTHPAPAQRGNGTKPAPAPAEEPAPVAPPAQKGPTLAPAQYNTVKKGRRREDAPPRRAQKIVEDQEIAFKIDIDDPIQMNSLCWNVEHKFNKDYTFSGNQQAQLRLAIITEKYVRGYVANNYSWKEDSLIKRIHKAKDKAHKLARDALIAYFKGETRQKLFSKTKTFRSLSGAHQNQIIESLKTNPDPNQCKYLIGCD